MKKNKIGLINLKMNDETYKKRQRVIKFIYEAKALLGGEMDRVEVRITEKEPIDLKNKKLVNYAGAASLSFKHISILDRVVKEENDLTLRGIVFHELVHTLFGVGHRSSCPLMKGGYNENLWNGSLSVEEQNKLFLKYAKENKKIKSSSSILSLSA